MIAQPVSAFATPRSRVPQAIRGNLGNEELQQMLQERDGVGLAVLRRQDQPPAVQTRSNFAAFGTTSDTVPLERLHALRQRDWLAIQHLQPRASGRATAS